MRIGDLRHRIVVQQVAANGSAYAWTDVATLWASVTSGAGGREFQLAKQARPTITHQIEIRYRPGISQDMQIIHDGRVLSIAAPPVDPEGRRIRHLIFCEEIATRTTVTFTRTTFTYDSATDTDGAPVTVSIAGIASATQAETDTYRRLGLTHLTAVTLYFAPDTPGEVPIAGDTVRWNGSTLTVAESIAFAPEGVALSATLVCRRG